MLPLVSFEAFLKPPGGGGDLYIKWMGFLVLHFVKKVGRNPIFKPLKGTASSPVLYMGVPLGLNHPLYSFRSLPAVQYQ